MNVSMSHVSLPLILTHTHCRRRRAAWLVVGDQVIRLLCRVFSTLNQTKMATSFGLTTSPYFSLKHWINRLRGDWAPKSINPSSLVLTAIVSVNAAVAFLSSSRSRAISSVFFPPPHEQSSPLLSDIKEGVWQLLSMRKPTCLLEVVASCSCIFTSLSPSFPESSSRTQPCKGLLLCW